MYSSTDFVRFLYEVVLCRTDPGPADVAHWAALLDEQRCTQAELFGTFLRTPEGRSKFRGNPSFEPVLAGWVAPPFATVHRLADLVDRAQIVDVGAMVLDDEDDVYAPLLRSERWEVVGFEPNEAECDRRRASAPEFRMLPLALGDGSERALHVNRGAATSSILPSNVDRLADFVGLTEWMTAVEVVALPTHRLDDVDIVRNPALLKLDVQGGELVVLAGATETLATTLVVHTETELFPLYEGNPLFGDVAGFLERHGFEFFTLHHEERYYHDDGGVDREWAPTRLLWADAVFVPERDRLDGLGAPETAALCWVMHDLYRAYDYCLWVLRRYDRRTGADLASPYAALLETAGP